MTENDTTPEGGRHIWQTRDVGHGVEIQDELGSSVAWIGFGSARSKEENRANATKMTAAPAMLEALQAWQDYVSFDGAHKGIWNEEDSIELGRLKDRAMALMPAALELATKGVES